MTTDLCKTDGLIFGQQIIKKPGDEPDRTAFTLRGDFGVITFIFSRNTEARHKIALQVREIECFDREDWSWTAWDIGCHAFSPSAEWDTNHSYCEFTGAACFYSGSALQAGELLKEYFQSGNDERVIYETLKDRYYRWLAK